MLKEFDEATAEAKKEWSDTLYQVAKMRAQFELLKQAIINNLELNYSGNELAIKDDRVVIEIMYLLENDQMENLFNFLKNKEEEKLAKATKEAQDNG